MKSGCGCLFAALLVFGGFFALVHGDIGSAAGSLLLGGALGVASLASSARQSPQLEQGTGTTVEALAEARAELAEFDASQTRRNTSDSAAAPWTPRSRPVLSNGRSSCCAARTVTSSPRQTSARASTAAGPSEHVVSTASEFGLLSLRPETLDSVESVISNSLDAWS